MFFLPVEKDKMNRSSCLFCRVLNEQHPVLGRGISGQLLEPHVEVCQIVESGVVGDGGDRRFGA